MGALFLFFIFPLLFGYYSYKLSSWDHAGHHPITFKERSSLLMIIFFSLFHFVLIQSGSKIKAVSSFLEALNFNPTSIQTPFGQTVDFDCGFSV